MGAFIGASRYACSEDRQGYHNGHKEVKRHTKAVGALVRFFVYWCRWQLIPIKWLDRNYVSWDNMEHDEEAEEELTENF